ncbi:MAG TPA: type II secretion system F family protein [Phycisphaerae bacterium]|nr:type II secretion system F family protein [Phycisphaerae bacterium]HUT57533.1 type II secretion system F family protein [Phycisphaerae bacterium]
MASFQYIAKSSDGKEVTGLMQADSESAVVRALDEKQLFPVRVQAQATVRRAIGGRIRLRDVSLMYGQLADLLHAGVPLLRAMETLIRASVNPRLVGVLSSVHAQVAEGKSLAEAMGEHPRIFTHLHTAMIRAGERAGFLEDVLHNLAGYLDRADELRSRVRGAMIYPLVLAFLGVAVLVGILIVLVPQFKPMFEGVSLPLPSRLMFAASDMILNHWAVLAGIVVLIVMGVVGLLRSEAGRRTWDRLRMRIPVAGRLIRSVCIARFCRILGTMLNNGVPILQSLSISKDATGSSLLAGEVEQATENVRAGNKLATPLSAGGVFPADVVEMIAVAEESNQLEKVLLQIADATERRVSRQVDVAVRLIEPLILVVIASVIAFVALGLFYPIFTMSQTLKFG